MAIARLGAIVAGIAGSLGEVTFANARGALVLRKRQWPPSHSTAATTTRKHAYSQIWRAYRALTDAQRASWTNGAASLPRTNRLGQSRPWSPWHLFYYANAAWFPITGAIIETFRTDYTAVFYPNPELTLTTDGPYELHAPSATTDYPQNATLRAARNFHTAPLPRPRNFRPTGQYAATSYSRNLYADITAAIGEPHDDEYITLRLRRVANTWPYADHISITAQVQPRGPEQITSGNFEPPWNPAAPAPWIKSGAYTLTARTLFPYADTANARLQFAADAGSKYLYQTGVINVTAGHTYRLSFSAQANIGTVYRINLYTAGTGYWTPVADLSPATWTRYQYDWTPGANGVNGDLLITNPPGVEADIELDNVSFREVL